MIFVCNVKVIDMIVVGDIFIGVFLSELNKDLSNIELVI